MPESVLPGAFINVVAKERATSVLSPRGVVAMPLVMNWGADDDVVSFKPKDYTRDSLYRFGYDVGDPELRDIGEIFRGATELLAVRLNTGGEKAACDLGVAKWSGTRGNDLTLTVEADPDAGYIDNAFAGVEVEFAAEGDTATATPKNVPENWAAGATLYRKDESGDVEMSAKQIPEAVDAKTGAISRTFPVSAKEGDYILKVSLSRGDTEITVSTGEFTLTRNPATSRYVTLTKGTEKPGTAVETADAAFDFKDNKITVTFSNVPEGYKPSVRIKGQVGILAFVPGRMEDMSLSGGNKHIITYSPGAAVNGEMTVEAVLTKDKVTVLKSHTYTAAVEGEDKPETVEAAYTAATPETFDEQIPAKFIVKTFLDGREVNKQKVRGMYQIKDTDFIVFNRTRELEVTAGMTLTGGTNGEVTLGKWSDALNKLEPQTFHTLGCPSTNDMVQRMFINFTREMRDEMGVKFQTVMPKTVEPANYEGVIQVENTVNDLDVADPDAALVYWVAGQEAGCKVQNSVANMLYDGVYDIDVEYTQRDLEAVVENGYFGFHLARGIDGKQYVKVLLDINTLTEPAKDQDESFKNNQTIRVCDQCANDIAAIFNNNFFGKVPNNVAGREAFRNKIIEHHTELETIQAIEDFDPDSVTVERGEKKTVVIATDCITPVNAMEQLYMTIIVA